MKEHLERKGVLEFFAIKVIILSLVDSTVLVHSGISYLMVDLEAGLRLSELKSSQTSAPLSLCSGASRKEAKIE